MMPLDVSVNFFVKTLIVGVWVTVIVQYQLQPLEADSYDLPILIERIFIPDSDGCPPCPQGLQFILVEAYYISWQW